MRITKQYFDSYRLAEQILTEAKVQSFPLDPIALAKSNGVLVVGYQRFSEVSGTTVAELTAISEDGFCMIRNGTPIIVYNRAVSSIGRKRWTILHELSHILLCHIDAGNTTVYERRLDARRWMEKDADLLTRCLIAPYPIALACGVKDKEAFRRLFGLSGEAAEHLYQDYRSLCMNRQILSLGSETFLSRFPRFLIEWQLNRLYLDQKGRNGRPDVTVVFEADAP